MPTIVQEKETFLVGGVNVVEVSIFRIPQNERKNHLFYYDVRHDGSSMDLVTIEKKVFVHYYGTIVTDAPLKCGEFGYLLTADEISAIYKNS